MARLLVTRPQPHAAGTAAALAALGHAPVLSPMLRVEPRADVHIGFDDAAALALTSRTAVEATAALARVRPDLQALFAVPVFTVGAATAEAARAAGFEQVLSADGAVGDLVRLIRQYVRPGDGAILHLGGAVRAGDLAGDLAMAGYSVSTIVVYEAVPATRLSAPAAAALAAGDLDAALVYSERTAVALVAAAAADGLADALAALPCLGLSKAVLAPLAAAGVRDLCAAAEPNENALFALLQGVPREV
ncbi:uroporphyrinogen-III synthase [Pseudoxanthobacter sp. M-2]|uniref:uroporphyrinogen-III synthase n=1 Tax=Pseudoxanthobacter sp. M-2 TaxID=3078754 RepID=UPI0038FD2ED0